MKILVAFVLFACYVFPVFSEDPNVPRYRELSESMGTSISDANDTLGSIDLMKLNQNQLNTFTSYRVQYTNLTGALRNSEVRLNQLIKTNGRASSIKEERDNYERLVKRLEQVKTEFDSWLSGVR